MSIDLFLVWIWMGVIFMAKHVLWGLVIGIVLAVIIIAVLDLFRRLLRPESDF